MPAATPMPSLSQVQALDTTYLREAADYWTRTANLWDQVFTEIHDRISTPGGTPWKGRAAAKEEERSTVDLIKVRGGAYQLHEAAAVARRGDEQLQACKDGVLGAVRDARVDGFDVGEDYSVTDRSRGGSSEFRATRQAAAQEHAAFIRHRVAALVATDQQITTEITAAIRGIDSLTFAEAAGADSLLKDKRSGVQLVDNKTPQPESPSTAGAGSPPQGPHLIYCYPHPGGPDPWLCEGWDYDAKRPYTFFSPEDLSGVA